MEPITQPDPAGALVTSIFTSLKHVQLMTNFTEVYFIEMTAITCTSLPTFKRHMPVIYCNCTQDNTLEQHTPGLTSGEFFRPKIDPVIVHAVIYHPQPEVIQNHAHIPGQDPQYPDLLIHTSPAMIHQHAHDPGTVLSLPTICPLINHRINA